MRKYLLTDEKKVADVLEATKDLEAGSKDPRVKSGIFKSDLAYLRTRLFSQFSCYKLKEIYDYMEVSREISNFIDQMVSICENSQPAFFDTEHILEGAIYKVFYRNWEYFYKAEREIAELVEENFKSLVYIEDIVSWIINRAVSRDDAATVYGIYSILARFVESCIVRELVISDYDYLWWAQDYDMAHFMVLLQALYKELCSYYFEVIKGIEYATNWEYNGNEENN